jgi:hypothetical protein
MKTNKVISALGHLLHQVASILNIQESREEALFIASNDFRTNTEI